MCAYVYSSVSKNIQVVIFMHSWQCMKDPHGQDAYDDVYYALHMGGLGYFHNWIRMVGLKVFLEIFVRDIPSKEQF